MSDTEERVLLSVPKDLIGGIHDNLCDGNCDRFDGDCDKCQITTISDCKQAAQETIRNSKIKLLEDSKKIFQSLIINSDDWRAVANEIDEQIKKLKDNESEG